MRLSDEMMHCPLYENNSNTVAYHQFSKHEYHLNII